MIECYTFYMLYYHQGHQEHDGRETDPAILERTFAINFVLKFCDKWLIATLFIRYIITRDIREHDGSETYPAIIMAPYVYEETPGGFLFMTWTC